MPTPPDHDRLRQLFDRPELGWLVDRLVRRVAAGQPLRGTLSVTEASGAQRRALDDLLGRAGTSGKRLSVDLDALEGSLREAGLLETLADVVTASRGVVGNRLLEKAARERAWDEVYATARRRAAGKEGPLRWVDRLEAGGLPKRLARGDPVLATRWLEVAVEIVARDPRREILLATLAAQTTGDSHALDAGQPLATLCLHAATVLHGADPKVGPQGRREAWSIFGVMVDDLSAPALAFNLRAAPGTHAATLWDCLRAQSQPGFFTYRQLTAERPFEPLPDGMETIFVCENPAVVSAAARELGPRCRPLVCTNGQPSSTVHGLLRQLRAAGSTLFCHADFDWTGLRIVSASLAAYAARPWRMGVDDYLACAGSLPLEAAGPASTALPDLAAAMRARGCAAFEEGMLSVLLADLDG